MSDEKTKVCPFVEFEDCMEERCAVWDFERGFCAFLGLLADLDDIKTAMHASTTAIRKHGEKGE